MKVNRVTMRHFIHQHYRLYKNNRLDWIVQCFTSLPTQYRLYGRRFLQVKRPNQQYQSTEGTHIVQKITEKHNNRTINTKHNKSPSL